MIDENFTYNVTYYYAEIDSDGYCVGLSQLSDSVENDSLIRIESMDDSYFNRKYDRETESWTDEYKPEPVRDIVLSEHEKLTKQINENVELGSMDNLLNMDMILQVDEKLNKLIKHLGI